MVNLINYNFMTRPAIHCIDESDEFYRSCGVSRGNKNGFEDFEAPNSYQEVPAQLPQD